MFRRRTFLRTAPIEPLDVDGVRTMIIGTGVWVVILVVSLVQRSELEADGNGWWLWTCVTGIGLGLIGVAYCLRRRARRAGRRA